MPQRDVHLGFLTIVSHPQHGLFGGYLVLNDRGRPREFHCTAPVKPSRAQEILFGPTLESFLCAEHIGQALVSKATTTPQLICTDVPAVIELQPLVEPPVLRVETPAPAGDAETSCSASGVAAWRLDGPQRNLLHVHRFTIGERTFALRRGQESQEEHVRQVIGSLAAEFDLAEPFERIRQAIEEAQRAGR